MALESESESAAALLLARLTGAAPFERRSGTRARGNDTATQDEDALAKQTARTFYAGQRINLGICLISSPAREIETGRRLRLMSRIGPTARPYRLHSRRFTRSKRFDESTTFCRASPGPIIRHPDRFFPCGVPSESVIKIGDALVSATHDRNVPSLRRPIAPWRRVSTLYLGQ